jgi:hypothetical protein
MFTLSLPFDCPISQDNTSTGILNELSTDGRSTHIERDVVIQLCNAKFVRFELTEKIAICVHEE